MRLFDLGFNYKCICYLHHVEWKLLLSNTFCIPICLLSIFCAWTYTLLGIWQIRKYSDLQKNVYIVYITYCRSWCWNTKQTQSNSSWLYRLLIMRLTHFFQRNQNVTTDCHSIYLVMLAWLQLWSLEPNKPQGVNISLLIIHTPIIFGSELIWIDGRWKYLKCSEFLDFKVILLSKLPKFV